MRKLVILLLLAFPLAAAEMQYIFTRGDSATISGRMNIRDIGRIKNRYSGDFLWVKLDGREYVIRDAATLAEAKGAFADVEANQGEYHALHARMKPIERKHDELEEQHDELSDIDEDDLSESEIRSLESRMRKLEEQMRPLERQLRALEEEEERLDEKQEKLEAVADRKLEDVIRRAIAKGTAQPF